MSQQQNNDMQQHFYRASAADFGKIPASPLAYWATPLVFRSFEQKSPLGDYVTPKQGLATGDNGRFTRWWHEVSFSKICYTVRNYDSSVSSDLTWVPYSKGGGYRKWYGFAETIVFWMNGGEEIRNLKDENGNERSRFRGYDFYFLPAATWGKISSGGFSCRYRDSGYVFDVGGMSAFPNVGDVSNLVAALNANTSSEFLKILSSTLNFELGDIAKIPFQKDFLTDKEIGDLSKRCIEIAKNDWDSFEVSWDFSIFPFMRKEHQSDLNIWYKNLREYWNDISLEMQRLEEQNNRSFMAIYGLQDELTPEVPLSEITLTCNPHYRYGGNLTDEEREARLQSDTIAELISYAIGCMMGRYSLDREGLVYAHAGNEGFKALVEEGAYASFAADEDGILPLSTDSWFEDDVATRLEGFVRTVWGTETLEENLQFIADSLCLSAIKPVKKGGETARETLRRYLSTQFYKDHLKTYKKRPIYWLFSSGKEKAFECLVYLHRYNEATLPRMRTEYVTPLLGQINSRIERLRLQQTEATTAEAKRLDKEIDGLTKQFAELRAFDDELKHYADMRITLDLDDGVKVNYGKFGTLLSDVKAITGDKGD